MRHAAQHFLLKNEQRYDNDPMAGKCTRLLRPMLGKPKTEIRFCGLEGLGDFHFSVSNENVDVYKFTSMFYGYSLSERDAFKYAIRKGDGLCEALGLEKLHGYYDAAGYRDFFRSYYGVGGVDDDRICEILDGCAENLMLRRRPKNTLSASIMYDMSCAALLRAGTITAEEARELMRSEQKGKAMCRHKYMLSKGSDMVTFAKCIGDFEYFRKLAGEAEHLPNNPSFVIQIAAAHEGREAEIREIVRKMTRGSMFRQYCIKHKDEMCKSEIFEETVKRVWGDHFLDGEIWFKGKRDYFLLDEESEGSLGESEKEESNARMEPERLDNDGKETEILHGENEYDNLEL